MKFDPIEFVMFLFMFRFWVQCFRSSKWRHCLTTGVSCLKDKEAGGVNAPVALMTRNVSRGARDLTDRKSVV